MPAISPTFENSKVKGFVAMFPARSAMIEGSTTSRNRPVFSGASRTIAICLSPGDEIAFIETSASVSKFLNTTPATSSRLESKSSLKDNVSAERLKETPSRPRLVPSNSGARLSSTNS